MTTEQAATPAQTEAPAPVAKKPRAARKARATKAPKKAKATKKAGPKGKSPNAGKVLTIKRSRDFKRIKRIGDKTHKVNLTHYKSVISASGNSSLDNGDDVASMLRGKSLDEVYKLAAKHTDVTEAQLRHNYEHLNAGMQRMNLGNKLRAALGTNDEE